MATIPFLPGYLVKPSSVDGLGLVTFTDGKSTNITPNQKQCEAYGYTYNPITGTCNAFIYSNNLAPSINNETNTVNGQGNTTGVGTGNTQIIGQSNTIIEPTRNNIIVGTQNQITENVNNTAAFGTLGEVTATNSIVLGGNKGSDDLGERQSIQLLFGVTTTDGTNTHSFLNNTTDSYFPVPENTILYFHADVIAVRIGGVASGNVGDYASWVERGVIINKSGTVTVNRERDMVKRSGTNVNSWQPTGIATGTNFAIRVRGYTGETIEWCSNIIFTQMKTDVAL